MNKGVRVKVVLILSVLTLVCLVEFLAERWQSKEAIEVLQVEPRKGDVLESIYFQTGPPEWGEEIVSLSFEMDLGRVNVVFRVHNKIKGAGVISLDDYDAIMASTR